MKPPGSRREVQRLIHRIAALNRFMAELAERSLPFFKVLCGSGTFEWGSEQQEAFDALKDYIQNLPMLASPQPGRPLILYVSATHTTIISSSESNTCLHTKAWKDTSLLVETVRSDFVASIARILNFIALELEDGALCSSFIEEACRMSNSRPAVSTIALSHCIILFSVNDNKVIFFSLCTRVYLLLLQWCIASVSNSQGWPNKKEHACMSTTSQSA
jgi:hypothetical protein